MEDGRSDGGRCLPVRAGASSLNAVCVMVKLRLTAEQRRAGVDVTGDDVTSRHVTSIVTPGIYVRRCHCSRDVCRLIWLK